MTLLRKHDSTPSSVPFTDPAAAGFALPPAAGLLGTLFRSASPTAASRPAGRSGSAQPGHAQPVCRAGAALLLAASLGAGAGLGTFLAMTPEEAFASYEEHLAAPAHGGASSLVEPAAPLSAQPAGLVMRGRPDPAQRTESRGINMPADHALPLMVPAGWICQGAAPAGTGTLSWERDEDWSAVMERLALAGSCRIQVDWDNRLIIVERAAPAATSSASAASGTGRAGMPGAQGAAGASTASSTTSTTSSGASSTSARASANASSKASSKAPGQPSDKVSGKARGKAQGRAQASPSAGASARTSAGTMAKTSAGPAAAASGAQAGRGAQASMPEASSSAAVARALDEARRRASDPMTGTRTSGLKESALTTSGQKAAGQKGAAQTASSHPNDGRADRNTSLKSSGRAATPSTSTAQNSNNPSGTAALTGGSAASMNGAKTASDSAVSGTSAGQRNAQKIAQNASDSTPGTTSARAFARSSEKTSGRTNRTPGTKTGTASARSDRAAAATSASTSGKSSDRTSGKAAGTRAGSYKAPSPTRTSGTPTTGSDAMATVWTLRPGSLKTQLEGWGGRQGWQVIWKADTDLFIEAETVFHGSFSQAVRGLFEGLHAAGSPYAARLWHGNRVLTVEDR